VGGWGGGGDVDGLLEEAVVALAVEGVDGIEEAETGEEDDEDA
jgi:hypothetical protein